MKGPRLHEKVDEEVQNDIIRRFKMILRFAIHFD